MVHLREPLLLYVFKRRGGCDTKANEKNVRVTANKEPNESQTGSVKQSERVRIFPNHYRHGVVIKDLAYRLASSRVQQRRERATYGRDILAGKFVGGVRYQKTSL